MLERSQIAGHLVRAVVGRAPDIVVGADLVVVQIALLTSAGRRPAGELQASAVTTRQGEVIDDYRAADTGVSDAAAELDVGLESGQAVRLVVGIRVGEARAGRRRCGSRRCGSGRCCSRRSGRRCCRCWSRSCWCCSGRRSAAHDIRTRRRGPGYVAEDQGPFPLWRRRPRDGDRGRGSLGKIPAPRPAVEGIGLTGLDRGSGNDVTRRGMVREAERRDSGRVVTKTVAVGICPCRVRDER